MSVPKPVPVSVGFRGLVNSSSSDRKFKFCKDTSKGTLNCWYTNAKSLRNKLYEFAGYVTEESPDIVVVTETWCKFSKVEGNAFSERDHINEYKIQGYELSGLSTIGNITKEEE